MGLPAFPRARVVVFFPPLPLGGVFPEASAGPAVPASSDTNATPVSDMTTPGAAATPATAADNATPAVAPGGKKNKKLVGAPDTQPPAAGQNGPVGREINIEYIWPKTVAKSVILSHMRTSVGDIYSAASVEEDVRNLYATG